MRLSGLRGIASFLLNSLASYSDVFGARTFSFWLRVGDKAVRAIARLAERSSRSDWISPIQISDSPGRSGPGSGSSGFIPIGDSVTWPVQPPPIGKRSRNT
jgi:hypothetical protein